MDIKPKVLLVDDEQAVRMSGKLALEGWFNITDVDRTSSALELLEKEKFDLVLLDIVIEDEGTEAGLEALKVINKKYPKLPVIILSGSLAWMQRWPELKECGAYGYLSKPFERNKAKEIIERCLKGEKIDKIREGL